MDKEELRERYEADGDERLYDEAMPLYAQALASQPAPDARLLLEYGYLQECHGRRAVRAAADCYQQAIAADPAWLKPHFQLIHAVAALGDIDRVMPLVTRYRERVNEAPDDPDGYYLLAAVYLQARDYESAGPVISSGLRIAPDDATLAELRGDLHAATGRPEEALAWWRRAAALAREDYGISMRYSAAFLLERLGRLAEAAAEWRFIIGWMEERGETIHVDWPRRELRRIETQLSGDGA